MYTKRYTGTGNKVTASSFFKRRNNPQKVPSTGQKVSTGRRVATSSGSKKVPLQPYGQLTYSPEMYAQYRQSVRFASEPVRHRPAVPQGMPYMGQMTTMIDDDEGPYDELEDLDSLECDRVQRKKKQDESRNRMKMIFAALMLPSLIALFNSHKKMNKGSESNIDIEALKSGGFPGFPGMAGGPMGAGGGGGGFGGGHRHGGIHPDFERDFEQMQQSHESPSEARDADANAKKASAQEYAERLMAQYASNSKMPPGASGDMDLGDEDGDASETTTAPADSAPDGGGKEQEKQNTHTNSSGKEQKRGEEEEEDALGDEHRDEDEDGRAEDHLPPLHLAKKLQEGQEQSKLEKKEGEDKESINGKGSKQVFTETSTESSGESPHDEL